MNYDVPTVIRRQLAKDARALLADFLARVASGEIYWR